MRIFGASLVLDGGYHSDYFVADDSKIVICTSFLFSSMIFLELTRLGVLLFVQREQYDHSRGSIDY